MSRFLRGLVLAAVVVGWGSSWAHAAAPEGKVRVLVTVGGHAFEEEPFWAMWKAMPGITFTKAELPKDAGLLKPGLEKDYDVIVMYDMVKELSPQQQQDFAALVKQGIGVVSWHHNMGANNTWDEFRKIVGGKFCLKDCEIDGKAYKQSTWDHDQTLKITVAAKDHPITKGLKDFVIEDEVYKGYWVSPEAKVLLTTDHPKNSPEIAWVHEYGNSRVFYFMLGHDSKAWKNASFLEILGRGIRWAAKR